MSDNGKAPKLRPGSVTCNDQTAHCWRTYKVVLPADAVLQDVHDYASEMFADCGFRADDTLRILAFDRSWACEVVVREVDRGRVLITKPTILWSGEAGREGVIDQDENYEIEWLGTTYTVFRKAQGDRARATIRQRI